MSERLKGSGPLRKALAALAKPNPNFRASPIQTKRADQAVPKFARRPCPTLVEPEGGEVSAGGRPSGVRPLGIQSQVISRPRQEA